ncbi:iron chelate uptake ABC transporter family permease subunit [Rhodovastum atsumiense]|uniref:Iron chelate uptake ABC transporter family permease subunit n=1 Tax=Rhodovastum atsumiense TaxID=504468 RepID=A0A5M6IU56_9PROT|nr:iron chelate uptake ABC transporter family permease subunit [Rhodovastum atsumiense]
MESLLPAIAAVFVCAVISVCIGVADLPELCGPGGDTARLLMLLTTSRVPRTLALIFAGAATAVAGLILQMMVRNRYVEPAMAGTVEGACLGMVLVMLFAPDLPVWGRMLVAAAGGLGATLLFLAILGRIRLRSMLVVPLTGIVLSGIIDAATTFIAYRTDLMQSLVAWRTGDFSQVLAGRYELLWIAGALTLLAAAMADRFTVAGLGRDTAIGLGVDHRRVVGMGLLIVAGVSASVVVTVGIIPFLGLVVPNVIALLVGDNLRRSVPLVALLGAGTALACDITGRLIRFPYEIPIGVVIGSLGAAAFLWLLARERRHLG